MRILEAGDIRDAVSMKEAIAAVREGFIALSAGKVDAPLRSAVAGKAGSTTLTMPAHVHGEPFTVVKVVSVCPENPSRGLPAVIGAVLVLDAATGRPLALMDGAFLTALRTGAASGLATDLLARPDASTLTVIGAGVQARTQVAAVLAVCPIREVRIYSLEGADDMAAQLEVEHTGLAVHVAASAADALRSADVICTATTSRVPVVHAADVKPGAHINGVGAFTPEMQEIATDVVQKARIVIDAREGALAEAGDLIAPLRQGLIREADMVEIGEVAAGTKPGRPSPDAITFFKSVGNAVQDAMVAGLAYRLAEARGLGKAAGLEVGDPKRVTVRLD